MPIQRQIGHQPLELAVLLTQLPQLAQLRQDEPTVLLLPDVELPICRHTSPTGVPLSACFRAYRIFSSEFLDRFIAFAP